MRVPDDLVRTIGTWAGEPGQAWLAALPRLAAECAEEWGLAVGEPCQPSGYCSLALRATRAGGAPCVLKLGFPDEWSEHEGTALRHYAGGAAVELYAEDRARRALLLERCEPGTSLLAEPDDVATRIVAETLLDLWSPPPEGHPYPLLADGPERWAAAVRASPVLPPRLRDETLDVLGWLRDDPADPVVLHCDLHPGNVLRAARRPWLAIDPKPAVGERAYDLAPVIRDRATAEVAPRRLAIVTEVTGLDQARVRGWALAQAVEGAASCHHDGDTAGADDFVAAGEAIAACRAS